MSRPDSKSANFLTVALLISGLLFIVSGLAVTIKNSPVRGYYQQITTGHQPSEIISTNNAEDEPDESKPEIQAQYEVAAEHPRRIIIEDIKVDGFVQQVEVNSEGDIAAPNNIHFAGWYNSSAKPGHDGLSIIDGHVHGRYQPGIFYNLAELKVGDNFQIELGDLSLVHYKVIRSAAYTPEQADDFLFRQFTSSQLNLITCTGNYNDQLGGYDKRHIIYAQRL